MKTLLTLLFLTVASPVLAVQPDEMLADPALEGRARSISELIRCPVCQGENIDDSNAPIAHDLRLLIRERLVAGDTDDQVVDFLVARYGDFILFRPRARGVNLILWTAGPIGLIGGLVGAGFYLRRRSRSGEGAQPLTADEQAELDAILKE